MFQTVTQRWKLLPAIHLLTTWLAHNKLKCGLFSRIISSYNSLVQNCQNLCSKCAIRTKCLKIEWSQNVLFAASRAWRPLKREAAWAACGFTGICHCIWVGGVKIYALLSAIYRIEYLIHKLIKSRGVLYRIDDVNVSNLILIITALYNNSEHLRLTR